MELILLCIQIFIFITYLTFVISKYGILNTISESYYKLSEAMNFLFTLFCWGVGFPLFIGHPQALFIASGTFLSFVGAAAMYRMDDKATQIIHTTGAIGSILFGFLGLGIHLHVWYPFILYLLSIIAIKILKIKNPTWWIETFAFIFIILGLIFKYKL